MGRAMTGLARLPRALLGMSIRGYQLLVSPVLPVMCRYDPSCSEYALEAVTTRGAVAGAWLAFRRVLRCHPWGGFGVDPVPGPGERP